MYQPGDIVCPADLPRRFLCRIEAAESFGTGAGTSQILKLTPLAGPWPPGTMLIRLDGNVVPARARQLWRARQPMSRPRPVRPAVRAFSADRGERATA